MRDLTDCVLLPQLTDLVRLLILVRCCATSSTTAATGTMTASASASATATAAAATTTTATLPCPHRLSLSSAFDQIRLRSFDHSTCQHQGYCTETCANHHCVDAIRWGDYT